MANKTPTDSDSDSEPNQSEQVQVKVRKSVSGSDEDSGLESDISEVVDEDDCKGEGTESEDEDDPSRGSNFPRETVSPEELETPNPELADDTNNVKVDIVPIAPATIIAASYIMVGNTVIESPSPPPSASCSRSPTPDPAKVQKTKHIVSPGKDAPNAPVPPEDADAVADKEGDAEPEADTQPVHHAKALDVSATTELKFALLREKLYGEKTEVLVWEGPVANGTYY